MCFGFLEFDKSLNFFFIEQVQNWKENSYLLNYSIKDENPDFPGFQQDIFFVLRFYSDNLETINFGTIRIDIHLIMILRMIHPLIG